jgi:hypothetical protein
MTAPIDHGHAASFGFYRAPSEAGRSPVIGVKKQEGTHHKDVTEGFYGVVSRRYSVGV